jgi:hypothetical protein
VAARTKKVILFIVEGPTDEDALGSVLKKIFQSEEVHFHVVHGDITSDWSVSTTNAIKTVNTHIEVERKRYGFQKKDIIKVIHLVDTDGTFIPANKVMLSTTDEIQYFEDRIESADIGTIVDRNKRKSQVLYRLYTTNRVGQIPYRVFYFSRNLEHVLHNDSKNLTDDEKEIYADAFADRYSSDPEGFKKFISSSAFTVSGEFIDTWNFIMQDVNSLNRYCNFHLLFTIGEQ